MRSGWIRRHSSPMPVAEARGVGLCVPPSLIAGGNQDLMLSADNVCGPMEAWKNRRIWRRAPT